MKKKSILYLMICLVFGSLLVVMLYGMSEKIVQEPSSFFRSYRPMLATRSQYTDIKYNSYYIAGVTSQHIYLGNVTAPFHLLEVNINNLSDTTFIELSVKNDSIKLTNYSRVRVDSPYFFIMDGITSKIYRGRMGDWSAHRFLLDSAYFTQSVPTGPASIAFRAKSAKTKEHVLGKISNKKPYTMLQFDLLQKQIDGIFCTDGKLHYSKKLNRLVYLYYYRNQFIVYDTNLNLDYRGSTIDTFSRAQVRVASIKSERKKTLAKAPKVINMQSCISENYLFIKSNLLAKNDITELFSKGSVIDVYDLSNNRYHLSFHIGKHYTKQDGAMILKSFQVYKNRIFIGIYDHFLVIDKLRPQYF